MKGIDIKKMLLSAMFLALGLILPFVTMHIQLIGNMLLPMHIPVFLCALICGWRYGVVVGLVCPLMRSFLFGMPPIYPSAISMTFELMTYAFVVGFLYARSKWQCTKALYRCMLIAMVSGRVVWGVIQATLLGISGNAFSFQAFIAGALLNAIPGIIIQLILIPAIMVALDKSKLVPFKQNEINPVF